ncbi:MAG TPA: TIR domain-containing protein [Thermoanaerobaculia bacterium]|nr:TIR domain-containing protein [Thermoanaerobaculia bacterium]
MSRYDVFLSHSSADKPAVESLARKLQEAGIEPFLDKWHLIPGDPWQEALEEALDASRTCAVFLGARGLGSWQNEEMRSALEARVGDRAFRVVPVLLPGSFEPREEKLPRFLRRLAWVDFRAGLDDEDAFRSLISGIRGQAPGPGGGGGPAKNTLHYRCMVAQEPEGWVHRQEYDEVREVLCSKGAQAGRSVGITTALRGAGGFGKTALAQKLCFDERVRETYPDGILWATLGEEVDSNGRLKQIRDLLRWWTDEEPRAFETVAAAGAKLRESLNGARALVVVDDVWKPDDVAPFQGLGESCALLITTRDNRTLPADSKLIRVDAMASSEAVDLLRAGLPGSSPEDFRSLAAQLGEWPLLLKLVNGPLREMVKEGLSIAEALREIEGALATEGFSAFDQNDSASRHAAASRAILVGVRRLPEAEQEFFFQLAIFPEDEDIPVSVLERCWGTSHFGATRVCQHLYDLSLLLEFDRKNGTVRLHDVTRRVLMEQRSGELSSLHSRLLEVYRPASGKWEDLSREESYLWRRLRDHFIGAGDEHEFKALLVRFPFIEAKLLATDINSLIADFEPFVTEDDVLRSVRDTFRLSAHVLARDRKQLAPQLLGRLLGKGTPNLHAFLEEAKLQRKRPWLRPRTGGLIHPGGALIRTFEGHLTEVNAVAVIDGRRVISASSDRTLRIWDLESGQMLRTLKGHIDWVKAVAVVDGRRAVSGSADDTLLLWDLETGQTLRIFQGHAAGINAVAVIDSRRFVSASSDRTLRVWDLESGQTLQTLEGHSDWVNAVVVVDNRRIVSASTDGTLRVWDLETGETFKILQGHITGVRAVAMMADGRAVSASADRTLRVWDLESGQTLRVLQGHLDEVRVVVPVAGGYALSASLDETVRIWDLESGQVVRTLQRDKTLIRAVTVLDGSRIVSADADGALRLWNLESRQPALQALQPSQEWVRALAVVPGGRAISADARGALRVWDLENGQTLKILQGHTASVGAVAVTADGRAISADALGILRVWDLENGRTLQNFKGHDHRVNAVAVLADGRVISASSDRTLRVWSLESGQAPQILEGESGVNAVAELEGGRVVSASNDGTLRVWSLESGQTLQVFRGHADRVNAVAVAPSGLVISASTDRTLRVWDLEHRRSLQILQGHTDPIAAIAMLADGRAVSASFDRTLRVWSLESGEELAVTTLDAPVWAVATTSDGKIIVAGDQSGKVHFFDLVEPGYPTPRALH